MAASIRRGWSWKLKWTMVVNWMNDVINIIVRTHQRLWKKRGIHFNVWYVMRLSRKLVQKQIIAHTNKVNKPYFIKRIIIIIIIISSCFVTHLLWDYIRQSSETFRDSSSYIEEVLSWFWYNLIDYFLWYAQIW